MQILNLLGMYSNVEVVFVTSNSLLFRLARGLALAYIELWKSL